MRKPAIWVALCVAACGGTVRYERSGGGISTEHDGGLLADAASAGGRNAGAGGWSSGGVYTQTDIGPPSGGRPGAAGFPAAGGATYPAAGGRATTSGGTTSSGGAIATGGTRATGGAGYGGYEHTGGFGGVATGGVGGGGAYVCSARAPLDPGESGTVSESCCGGVGKCTARADLKDVLASSYGHDTCDPTLVCAPSAPASAPPKCTTKALTSDANGLEGRCISTCFFSGNPLAVYLDPTDPSCPSGSVCAPCYDPVDATPTGACTMKLAGGGQDAPVQPSPPPFAVCPEGDAGVAPYAGGGLCVPTPMLTRLDDPTSPVYDPLIHQLRQDSCRDGERCVPRTKAMNPRSCATPCKTSQALSMLGFANGGCLPTFVVYDTKGQAGVTISLGKSDANPPSDCAADQACYPCADPLTGGTPSGACY